MTNNLLSKPRRTIGRVLVSLGALVLIISASGKLANVAAMVQELNAFGFQGKIQLMAALELTCLLLYLFSPTRSLGLLLISAYLGGAIATHWQHAPPLVPPPMIPPLIILMIFWVGTWLLYPQVLWSLNAVNQTQSSVNTGS